MGIIKSHTPLFREVFNIPGILSEPVLTLGYQDIIPESGMPKDFLFDDLNGLLASRGVKKVVSVDLFDGRADLKYDLNNPVPLPEHEQYGSVMDIGTLEHIFDTRTCLENCLRMVRVGGYYFLHTPVNGYFAHGLHVFNPQALIEALRLNHFEIVHLKYSTIAGVPVDSPDVWGEDVLIWVAAKKTAAIKDFKIPQQGVWKDYYTPSSGAKQKPPAGPPPFLRSLLKGFVVIFLSPLWQLMLNSVRKIKKYLN
jgi:hypothetical protein